jgi:hypothetical protein
MKRVVPSRSLLLLLLLPIAAFCQELRFLDAERGGTFLSTPDEYTRRMNAFDIQVMMRTDQPRTIEQYLALAKSAAMSWTPEEQQRVSAAYDALRAALQALSVPLVPRIDMIKTSGLEEWNAAYTRGAAIILPASYLGRSDASLRRLMAHELFHVLARAFPDMTRKLYPALGFQPCGEIAMPPAMSARVLNNPDTPVNDHCIEVMLGAERVAGMPVMLSPDGRFDPKIEGGIGAVIARMQTGLMVVQPGANGGPSRPVLHDGEPRIIPWPEVPDLSAKIGRNTGYLIHAEEMLADNFALLVTGAANVASPEVLERMRAALKN